MNFNNYTIKTQEALQHAQQIAQGYGHQHIENEHVFKSIYEVDQNVLPFFFKKLNLNSTLVLQLLEKELESFPKVSGGDIMLSKAAMLSLN
jgi:ATP-dependent Clp protease ATP-binding subunit ClpB